MKAVNSPNALTFLVVDDMRFMGLTEGEIGGLLPHWARSGMTMREHAAYDLGKAAASGKQFDSEKVRESLKPYIESPAFDIGESAMLLVDQKSREERRAA
jgi:hypothetical protein